MAEKKNNQSYLEYLIITIETNTEDYHSRSKNWEHLGKSIGDMLRELKMKLPHGEFMIFCKNRFNINDTSTKRFIQMSKFWMNRPLITGLSKSAFYEIIKPSVSEEMKNHFYEQAKISQPLSSTKTKKLINQKKKSGSDSSSSLERSVSTKKRISLLMNANKIFETLEYFFCRISEKNKTKIIGSFKAHIINFIHEDQARYNSGERIIRIFLREQYV